MNKPQLRVGQNAKAALAKTDAALDEANARLGNGRGWYEGVERDYAGAGAR